MTQCVKIYAIKYWFYYRYFTFCSDFYPGKIFDIVNGSRADDDHIHCTARTGDFPPVERCFDRRVMRV